MAHSTGQDRQFRALDVCRKEPTIFGGRSNRIRRARNHLHGNRYLLQAFRRERASNGGSNGEDGPDAWIAIGIARMLQRLLHLRLLPYTRKPRHQVRHLGRIARALSFPAPCQNPVDVGSGAGKLHHGVPAIGETRRSNATRVDLRSKSRIRQHVVDGRADVSRPLPAFDEPLRCVPAHGVVARMIHSHDDVAARGQISAQPRHLHGASAGAMRERDERIFDEAWSQRRVLGRAASIKQRRLRRTNVLILFSNAGFRGIPDNTAQRPIVRAPPVVACRRGKLSNTKAHGMKEGLFFRFFPGGGRKSRKKQKHQGYHGRRAPIPHGHLHCFPTSQAR